MMRRPESRRVRARAGGHSPHVATRPLTNADVPRDLVGNVFEGSTMAGTHLSIRIDLPSGSRIGPGKIALLEAIRSTGSISAAARSIGMSYRRAWLLVEEINQTLREPAVTAETGGARGGGAVVTPVGEKVVGLYRAIESQARAAAGNEFRAIGRLIRHDGKGAS
jgi:molybdate transport system regulatory protein